ncbi:MAG: ABC transporter ATP-binding protein [Bradymonadia bacterium]
MISIHGLKKRYGDLVAVKGVSFEVGRGEIVGLLGHNGAGKTTVMKILTGYLEPTQGTVTVGGADVLKARLQVQKQIGYLPESAPLYPEMLVQEYLIMMAELRQIPQKDRLQAISDAVRATGLSERLTQSIGTLSKGYKQRVGLAGAILHRPDVLVLDEPTNGLDPVQIVEIRRLIKQLAEHSTVILSTHILSEIEAICDRVLIMIDGHLAADARLEEMLATDTVLVSVADGTDDVVGVLRGVKGVQKVKAHDADPHQSGFMRWRVTCEGETRPIPEIIKAATERSWVLGGIAPEITSLENVFRDLMSDHASVHQEATA